MEILVKKKRRLQNIIYATVGGFDIIRIEAHALLKVEEAFSVGSVVPLRINGLDKHSGTLVADIAWELTRFSTPKVPAIGEVRRATVIFTYPHGAHCLLDNLVVGFVHRSSILGEVEERLDT